MQASHVVVDTRDGYTWWRDAAGQLLTLETARTMADQANAECKPEHQTYEVLALEPVTAGQGPHSVAYCQHPRHGTPCPLPCDTCAEECTAA